ncbi:hypothetical protein HY449_04040 [Candidatus Pacearchaeota archaeon]|nr:hypothetical protein [Candidatus Pacearchaeota archaeon]
MTNVSYLRTKMVSITLSIPEELKQKMDKSKFINWSALARESFLKKMEQLEILDKLEKDFSKSELTDEECLKLGRKLRRIISEKHKRA